MVQGVLSWCLCITEPQRDRLESSAAGLGDVMRSPQTSHKPLAAALRPSLPGQSAAAEVSLTAFHPSRG